MHIDAFFSDQILGNCNWEVSKGMTQLLLRKSFSLLCCSSLLDVVNKKLINTSTMKKIMLGFCWNLFLPCQISGPFHNNNDNNKINIQWTWMSSIRLDISANLPRWKILHAGNLRAGKVLLEMLEKRKNFNVRFGDFWGVF